MPTKPGSHSPASVFFAATRVSLWTTYSSLYRSINGTECDNARALMMNGMTMISGSKLIPTRPMKPSAQNADSTAVSVGISTRTRPGS